MYCKVDEKNKNTFYVSKFIFDDLNRLFLLNVSDIRIKKWGYHINLKEGLRVGEFLRKFLDYPSSSDDQVILGFDLFFRNDLVEIKFPKSQIIPIFSIYNAPIWVKILFFFDIKEIKVEDNEVKIKLIKFEKGSSIFNKFMKALDIKIDKNYDNDREIYIITIERLETSIRIKFDNFVLDIKKK